MIYTIYQIQLTKEMIEAVNKTGDFNSIPAIAAKIALELDFDGDRIGGIAIDALEAGYYKAVAHIEAESLNEVFEIGNIGPQSAITRFGPMSSVSVGNMIVGEDGDIFVVAHSGFVGVGVNKSLAA